MPTKIRFLESPPLHGPGESEHYDGTLDFSKFAVGDMAYFHYRGEPLRDQERLRTMHLTAHYFAANAWRPPLVLALPDHAYLGGRLYFLVDGQCYSNSCTRCGQKVYKCPCAEPESPRGYYDGWTVSGTPPTITVSPSVNFDDDGTRHYHGFVQSGVVGDG